jgi:hypothetical protein
MLHRRVLMSVLVWEWKLGANQSPVPVQVISGERRDLAFHHQLDWKCGILRNLGPNVGRMRGGPPIGVKGDENPHATIGSRLVGIAELLVGVWIRVDVERECVNTDAPGPSHIIVIVCRAGSVTKQPNLSLSLDLYIIESRHLRTTRYSHHSCRRLTFEVERVALSGIFLPPTASKVLVGLDEGAQACLRIIILGLNSKGKHSHEVIRCLDPSQSSGGTILSYLFIMEGSH